MNGKKKKKKKSEKEWIFDDLIFVLFIHLKSPNIHPAAMVVADDN